MSEQMAYQFAILHYMHDSATEERLNIGLAVYCPAARYFRTRILSRYKRLADTFPGLDTAFYRRYVDNLQDQYERLAQDVASAQLEMFGERPDDIQVLLHRVLPPDDSAIQFAEPRYGATDNIEQIFEVLFSRIVDRYNQTLTTPGRTDDDVWSQFRQALKEGQILRHLRPVTIQAPREKFKFEYAFKNGRINVLYPQSFDLVVPTNIRAKARTLIGTAIILTESKDRPHMFVLAGKPTTDRQDLLQAYWDAKGMLEDQRNRLDLQIVEENQAEALPRTIKALLETH